MIKAFKEITELREEDIESFEGTKEIRQLAAQDMLDQVKSRRTDG
jgi:hypothetical protein